VSQAPSCYVHGVGTAVPDRALTTDEAAQLLQKTCRDPRTAKLLRRVARLTGIETRHLAALDIQFGENPQPLYKPPDEQPYGPGMGARNALFERVAGPLVRRALEAFSPQSLARVQSLVTCSCTHASSPGLEQPIFVHTSVPTTVDRWNLGFMGCSAALAGLRLIHQTAALGRHALVVACEISSLHFQYTDALDQMTANMLFSDGAAAILLDPEPSTVRIVDCRCAALPAAADQMVWFADDHGLRLELAQELPETLGKNIRPPVEAFLLDNHLAVEQVGHWLVHPGGPQILDAVQEALGLAPDALEGSRAVLRRYGNMSSPTILFILRELCERKVGGWCLAMAFGPGLTIEMVLLEIKRGE